LILCVVANCSHFANAQSVDYGANDPSKSVGNTAEVLKKLDQLIEQNVELEKRNRELMEEIQSLRGALGKELQSESRATLKETEPAMSVSNAAAAMPEQTEPATKISAVSPQEKDSSKEATAAVEPQEQQKTWGSYTPNLGFKVANTEHGDLNVSIYSYVRYLNQLALASTYTDAFGNVKPVVRRQEMQILKVQMKFLGWIMSPKLRYFLYAWSSNASQGQGAQVVLAGNLNYKFNDHLTLGGGIYSLPGTRSVEGNFPFWLSVDNRLIADEFFRPSYTSGVYARGVVVDRLRYLAMLGNNLSQLGVSALQLDNGFNTFSGALIWEPTTGEFGQGFGDFEDHQKLATRLAGHFTRSHETLQSQPGAETFENTQIRLADGTVIFTPNIFGPGITVNEVDYKMAAFDAGLKYHGFSLWGEYYLRWLNNFVGPGTAGLPELFDHGFQLQISKMVSPKTLQAYAAGSTINGKYGNPWDTRVGLSYFPFKNRVVRWNNEVQYLNASPVGYTAVPYNVGSKGFVFHTNLEVAF
jgi:hypothetical protein